MKIRLIDVLLASALLIFPVVGNAQELNQACEVATTPMIEQRSCACLLRMLEDDASAEALVRATVATGLGLAEATVFALECGGENNQVAIAVAGVMLAGSLAQAQSVANAVLAIVSQSGEVADAVREAVGLVARELPRPGVYVDEYTPTGTDVSPAS
jgi:hypothetical protein